MSANITLPEQFKVRLTMLSDWHVGSGTGRPGHIDRLILRDADGLPFVPAKTLHGMWRDACELLCRGLDDGQIGKWSRLVDHIFGSQPSLESLGTVGPGAPLFAPPLPASFRVRPAYLVPSLREVLVRADRRIIDALTFIKPGVRIDMRSGSAMTEHLRFEEMARIYTPLEADCFLSVPESMREAVSALLIASARLVERLGGKRRRGAGRCQLDIVVNGRPTSTPVQRSGARSERTYASLLKAAVDYLRAHREPPDWPVAAEESEPTPPTVAISTAPSSRSVSFDTQQASATVQAEWVCVPIKLALQGPLAVTYRTTGNVVTSLDHLPGFYLLPHITRVYPELRGAVPSGDVIVLPAYPEVNGERGEPVPLAFFQIKDSQYKGDPAKLMINRLVEPAPEQQLKQVRGGYVARGCPSLPFTTPLMMLTHNTVDDTKQRPDEQTGGVYTYEAIAPTFKHAGQPRPVILRSELRLRKSLADKLSNSLGRDWWKKLNGTTSLGRSKKDDYGNVELIAEEPYSPAHAATQESQSDVEQTGQQGNVPRDIFVWILSDTLLRNDQLRFEASPETLVSYLAAQLGIPLQVRNSRTNANSANSTVLDVLVRQRRLEPWHVGWGLPRPSLVAIQAGSCLVLRTAAPLNSHQLKEMNHKLRQLELSGIGERTAEGFGQVRFNDPMLTESHTSGLQAQQSTAGGMDAAAQGSAQSGEGESRVAAEGRVVQKDDATFSYARLIESECWKQEIRRAALRVASDEANRRSTLDWRVEENRPPMSQLGALRSQLARVHSRRAADAVKKWIDHLENNVRRQDKWPGEAINCVREILTNPQKIWEILEVERFPVITDNACSELKNDLWPYAVRTFFDACVRAHKRDLEARSVREGNIHGG